MFYGDRAKKKKKKEKKKTFLRLKISKSHNKKTGRPNMSADMNVPWISFYTKHKYDCSLFIMHVQQMIHMKCQALFSIYKCKNISECCQMWFTQTNLPQLIDSPTELADN